MTPKWSANKVSLFIKISLDNKERQMLYRKISQKNPRFSHHQVRKWLRRNAPWETTWYFSSARETSSMIRRSSWAGTKHRTESFYHALLEICTHRWSLVPSTILRLGSATFLRLKEKHFDRPEKKAICERKLDNFLKKYKWSRFFIVHCTKAFLSLSQKDSQKKGRNRSQVQLSITRRHNGV